MSIFEEINYLPGSEVFSRLIGGHCVMANIALLKRDFSSDILDAIEQSNVLKKNLQMTGLVADESAPEHTARKDVGYRRRSGKVDFCRSDSMIRN